MLASTARRELPRPGDRVLTLSPDEIVEITGKRRHAAQLKVLRALEIPFRVRPDGSLLVLRVHVIHETENKEPSPPELCLS